MSIDVTHIFQSFSSGFGFNSSAPNFCVRTKLMNGWYRYDFQFSMSCPGTINPGTKVCSHKLNTLNGQVYRLLGGVDFTNGREDIGFDVQGDKQVLAYIHTRGSYSTTTGIWGVSGYVIATNKID